ncbi:MAG: hypothetical protein GXX96_31500 [Planctomycetaceae bacterium]|nr:hypothetical protein [Planctomycetaceae bacterium]
MKRYLLIALIVVGCYAGRLSANDHDAASVDLAVATIAAERVPAPRPPQPYSCPRCQDTGWITHGDGHRTPCPDCSDGSSGPYGGPLDTLRDAKDLIRKGNDLADRSKALLDAAQRDGKITVDVHLPDPNAPAAGSCPGGVCPAPLAGVRKPVVVEQPTVGQQCPGGVCQPRLLWRSRR